MSTNKTQHYQLHSWAAEDKFLRGEMNENFTAIDTAIQQAVTAAAQAVQGEASARTGAVNSLNGAVSALQTALGGKVGVVTGAYTGDGSQGRAMNLGFQPKAVFVLPMNGQMCTGSHSHYGGLALPDHPAGVEENAMITITATGFQVSHIFISHNGYNEHITANEKEKVYHYLAVR